MVIVREKQGKGKGILVEVNYGQRRNDENEEKEKACNK